MFISRVLIVTMAVAFGFDLFLAGVVYWCYRQARENPDAMTQQGIPTTRKTRFQAMLVIWLGYTLIIAHQTWNVLNTRPF
jgi:hypothetical protein